MLPYPYTIFFLLFAWTSLAYSQAPVFIVEATPSSCQDASSSLQLTISAGVFPIDYSWQQQSTGDIVSSGTINMANAPASTTPTLSAGNYVLQLEDNNGLTVEEIFSITPPPPILLTDFSVIDATCANDCNGAIDLVFSGGFGTLTIHWVDDPNNDDFSRSQLCGGEYFFRVEDEAGCTQKGSIPILAPLPIIADIDIETPTCLQANDGSVNIQLSGGTGEHQLSWSDGNTSSNRSNLAPDSYSLTVTDANDCLITETINIPTGPPLVPNIQLKSGCGDGQILVSTLPIHGSAPYEFQWNTGSTNPALANMTAGSYSLFLTDANGCTANEEFSIPFVPPIAITSEFVPVSCPAATDGALALSITGGMPPFQVEWDNGMTGEQITGLSGGEYVYNVLAAGCGRSEQLTVPEPLLLTAEVVFIDPIGNTLTGQAIVTGGTPPYTIQWSHGANGATAINLQMDQDYSIEVTDANNCSTMMTTNAQLTNLNGELFTMAKLFPNPTRGQLFLESNITWTSAEWLDSTGQTLKISDLYLSSALDISDWPSGVYVIRLRNSETTLVRQIVKY